jgi:hypothetical protein
LILEQLGTGDDAVAAARGLVAAEQNFNPFAVSIPSICSDPTLPANELLRGIIPLIDPAVVGSNEENANSAASLITQLDATGLSVAEVMVNAGFSNFTTEDVAGTAGAAPGGAAAVDTGAATAVVASTSAAAVDTGAAAAVVASTSAAAVVDCGVPATTFVTVTKAAAATASATGAAVSTAASTVDAGTAAASGAAPSPSEGVDPGQQVSSLGLDFGTCTPTIKFEAGLDGRKDTEFTFQAIDPVVNKGQEEALNPNIITNRICDQLTNVCSAAADAITACDAAKAQISALGTKDVTTADAWNAALGFAGTNTNPDNAPQAGLVGHT